MNIPSQQRLLEVAKLLPQEAATVLTEMDESAQVYLLKSVAMAIDYWESTDVHLDPVQFDIVVTSIIAAMAPTIRTLDAALDELMVLQARNASCSRCKN